jgi:hypothetical protein
VPGGPLNRRARWHEILSRFHVQVEYVKGVENGAADGLSRLWMYPSTTQNDETAHGTPDDEAIVEEAERADAEPVPVMPVVTRGAAIPTEIPEGRFPLHHSTCGCRHCSYRKSVKTISATNWFPPACCQCDECLAPAVPPTPSLVSPSPSHLPL